MEVNVDLGMTERYGSSSSVKCWSRYLPGTWLKMVVLYRRCHTGKHFLFSLLAFPASWELQAGRNQAPSDSGPLGKPQAQNRNLWVSQPDFKVNGCMSDCKCHLFLSCSTPQKKKKCNMYRLLLFLFNHSTPSKEMMFFTFKQIHLCQFFLKITINWISGKIFVVLLHVN